MMKKGIAIAIGIAVAIVIVIVAAGMTSNMGTETRTSNGTNVTSIQPPSVVPGKNLSVTLSENVGVGAH
jgi:ABC-type lipoprotein release transport system permease subunit